jgi:BirA family transcriptional regulator, biotin operon repressor / biotin---[acetyl-CoA-carboxylase] ligase
MDSEEELRRKLTTHVFGQTLYAYDSINSTNAYAKNFANKGAEEGTVVLADYQTAGRGRLGRSWLAEPGDNLLFSVIIRPTFSRDKLGLLSFFAATAIADAVEAVTALRCETKWPNDILLHQRKICGILMESAFQNTALAYVIMGIGVNVNQQKFLGYLAGTATSLRNECKREFDRNDLFCKIMSSLESMFSDVKKGDFSAVLMEWKARATIFGQRISLTQGTEVIDGTAIDLAPDGGLLVETGTGRRVFYAGDVTLAKQAGRS